MFEEWFKNEIPKSSTELYSELYSGSVYLLPPSKASLELVSRATDFIKEVFEQEEIRNVHAKYSGDIFFEKVKILRKEIYLSKQYKELTISLIDEIGLVNDKIAFDPMRIRALVDRGWENPKAVSAYYAHRDTWYAHSHSEINWWLPLHDVEIEDTFSFFPEYFNKEVPNNSEVFDYDQWTSGGDGLKIGWQNKNAGIENVYPGQTAEVPITDIKTFSAKAGSRLVFAGTHFHQTNRVPTGKTRFSIDFRMVNLAHHEISYGAPNVDNRSRGDAVRDFVRI